VTKVLYIGGTGTISASCVARSVREGAEVHILNRGRNASGRPIPDDVSVHVADVHDVNAVLDALAGHEFDCVVDFLSFDEKDAAAAVCMWTGRTGQYIQISSASIYHKPVRRVPFTESTPRHNPFLPYARAKIAAENAIRAAYEETQFPATIVRPSHTYDDARPPLPGDWTVWDGWCAATRSLSRATGRICGRSRTRATSPWDWPGLWPIIRRSARIST
jgi:nucleoside-diphosphate-sugar epimerase